MRRLRHPIAAALLALVTTSTLTGCGGSSSSGGGGRSPEVVDVTFQGDQVTPNGERVQVSVGQPVTLHVTADKPGEIHVHADPEQELRYDAGTSDLTLTPIEKPGVVEVESHTLGKVLFSLEVR